jgi:hypothetical protein
MAFPLPAPSPSLLIHLVSCAPGACCSLVSPPVITMHLGYASVIDIALSSRYYLYCQHTRTVHIFASYALKN